MFVKSLVACVLISSAVATPLFYITDKNSMDTGAIIFTKLTASTRAVVTTPEYLNNFLRDGLFHEHFTTMIDLREKSDYESEHVHEAISVPIANDGKQVYLVKDEVAEEILESDDMKDKRYVVFYCNTSSLRAPNIAAAYYNAIKGQQDFEHQTVVILMGGFDAAVSWSAKNAAGLEFDCEKPSSELKRSDRSAETDNEAEIERQLVSSDDLQF